MTNEDIKKQNMALWDAVKSPPNSVLKLIMAGRLKGKSDINPQWRYKAMTEHFGQCGWGWKYEIDKVWTEVGSEGQVMCFAIVKVYTNDTTAWSQPIFGIGGSMLVVKESSGLHTNDEGYKMAVTDALSVAFKMLGFGAEVYLGHFDGSKYRVEQPDTPPIQKTKAKPEPVAPVDTPKVEVVTKDKTEPSKTLVEVAKEMGAVEVFDPKKEKAKFANLRKKDPQNNVKLSFTTVMGITMEDLEEYFTNHSAETAFKEFKERTSQTQMQMEGESNG